MIADSISITARALEGSTNPVALGLAAGAFEALNADATYLAEGVPELVINRSGTTVEVNVTNKGNTDVKIYRADDYRGNFIVVVQTPTIPYSDEGLDASFNYKYKASFIVTGTKGGDPFTVESQRSASKYTKGT